MIYMFCIRRGRNDYDFGLPQDLLLKHIDQILGLHYGVKRQKLDLGGNEDVDMCYWGEAYLAAIKDAIAEFHE
ncbi:hypothetical protein FCV25MIE_02007, partial [Fagus crenata]